jgi:hypothetical protein
MSEYISHILRSIVVNYKSWFVLFISCLIICRQNIVLGFIQYILCIFYAYLAHRAAHEPIGFFFNRAHIYHHEHTNWMSHAIQVCVELAASFSPIFILYYILDLKHSIFPFYPYVFLLFIIFYTSTHNINYGQLHVNKVHAKHHADYSVNYGPDICDIVFGTKYPKGTVENTDHYIPNIIVATIFTYFFREYYENLTDKQSAKKQYVILYAIICFIVSYFTTKQSIIDLERLSIKELKEFNDNINSLLVKLKS